MNAPLNHFLGAVMLLTRAPVGRFYRHKPGETLAHAVVYFPLVGLLVGVAGGLAGWAATFAFPVPLAALICMLSTVIITGGFHEDGLADAADGLFGGHTPARRLEIMKDSRLGTYGAVALWFTLMARFLLLQELLRHAAGALFLCMLASAHTLGRGAAVLLLQALPYVSGVESKSRGFAERLTPRQMAFALLLPIGVVFVLPGPCGPSSLIAATLVAVCAGRWFRKKIGGITGDCLGATNQLVELACYGVAVIYLLHPFSGSLSLAGRVPVVARSEPLSLARPFNAGLSPSFFGEGSTGAVFAPEGQPILARDFSPWMGHLKSLRPVRRPETARPAFGHRDPGQDDGPGAYKLRTPNAEPYPLRVARYPPLVTGACVWRNQTEIFNNPRSLAEKTPSARPRQTS